MSIKKFGQTYILENENLCDPTSPTLSDASSGESQWQKSDSGIESLSQSPPTPPEPSIDPNPVDQFLKHLGTLPMEQVLFKIGIILGSQKMDPFLMERMLNDNVSSISSDKAAITQPWSGTEAGTNVIDGNGTKIQFQGERYFQYPRQQQTEPPTRESIGKYISAESFSSASGSTNSLSTPTESPEISTKQIDISSYPRHICSQLPPPNLFPSPEFSLEIANLPPPEYL